MSNSKVDKIYEKTRSTISNNEKVKGLLGEVKERIDRISVNSEERSSFINELQIIIRMIKAHFQGDYKAFSFTTISSLVFALVYFITPIDLIPDFIPALGLTDDISIVYMILRSVAGDISKFKVWEESN